MPRWRQWICLGALGLVVYHQGRPAHAAAEVKLDKDFINGIVSKLPPTTFEKADKYRGTVHSFRLLAIDPRTRRFLIACQIEGEFHPPVTGPISERVGRSPQTPEGWRKFRFDVKACVNIEPGSMEHPGSASRSMRSRNASWMASPASWPGFWVNTSTSW